MTATDELRRLLDERREDYRVSATGYSIEIGPYITAYANRSDTTLDVSLRQVTPEQAIDATLGRGTCKRVYRKGGPLVYQAIEEYACSACGNPMTDHDSYCSECGREVVDA